MLLNFSFSYIKNLSLIIIESKASNFSLLLNIIFIIVFLIIVYFTTKYIGKYAGKKMAYKEIKIIEKTNLGFDKSLVLVEVRSKTYFMFFDKNGFKLIDNYEKKLEKEN
ncbi:flagellar biosynthetic protein FliO [Helicovermis profundi]|uniref:Uncharacterized protein n=1 Tax=Helicovermis profundi TaxID=3065157 RepID=A0AAU9ESD4_9FIRM|nr:hypothetical protein HLPR_16960 [Clostridia bacterium S502]